MRSPQARRLRRTSPKHWRMCRSEGAAFYRRGMSSAFVVERLGGAPCENAPPPPRQIPDDPALSSLRDLLSDPEITDIFINGGDGLYVDRGAGAVRVEAWSMSEAEVRDLAIALVAVGGRHIDDATPCVDVRWSEGIRVHAVLPPVSCTGAAISIRLPGVHTATLDLLSERGLCDAVTRATLNDAVTARTNILISGATGSGKTTLLSALLGEVAPTERIVTIEDVAELRIRHPHHVRLEARQPNIEGAGEITLRRLVREALRMRPDRLVVGECRGEEIRDLLSALNTGHDGGAVTVHASSVDDVPARLEALGLLAGLSPATLARQVVSAIGLVVHLERTHDGVRQVSGMAVPEIAGEHLVMRNIA